MTVYKVVLNGSGLLEMKVTAESGDNHLIYLLPIVTGYTLTEISSGSYFAVALDITGRAWGWAVNTYGQLGTNNITCYSSPVSVVGGKNFCHISTGNYHSLAIESNGQAWAWGENTYGNLGTNNTTSYSSPVSVVGGKTFCKISGGFEYSLAIDNLGQAWAWGSNINGELGVNNTTNYSSPVAVCGNHIFCYITAGMGGGGITYAIDTDGKGWAWGRGDLGILGNNTCNVAVCTPVAICPPY